MSVISINEVKRQKPSSKEVPLSIKDLEKELPNIMEAINNGGSLEFVSNSFGFLLIMLLSILINIVMDYVIHDM